MTHARTTLPLLLTFIAGCTTAIEAQSTASSRAELFAPDVISDAREQWRITFTRDGNTAYFAASDGFFPFTRQATIYESRRINGSWSTPRVASFSGTYSDIDPALAPDGSRLYFSSTRPVNGVNRGDVDLWMVERRGNDWGEPQHLGASVNSELDELYSSVDNEGTLYFAAGPRAPSKGQHYDIYRAKASKDAARGTVGFAPRERMDDAVNTSPTDADPHLQAAWEFNPEISPDGRTLFFTSLRPGGQGLGDIYISTFENGAWTRARNLGPTINTAADEYHPTRSPDGEFLYFVRRQPQPGDFYRIPLATLIAQRDSTAPTGLLDALIRGGRAQQQGNFDEMRRLLRAGNAMAPGNGQVLYFLAREEARAGSITEAFALLEQLTVQGIARDIRADTGFNILTRPPHRAHFDSVAQRLALNAAPLVRSDTHHVLTDPDFIPEGVAYDTRTRSFFVGSLHRRSVVRIDSKGRETVFISPGRDGIGQVLGMHIDVASRRLWLATLVLDSVAPRHSNGGGGWAFVHAYDLRSGQLVRKVAAPDSALPHLLNDLVVTGNGDVYVTDTEAHAVYRLRAGATRLQQVFGGNERFRYPNGIALDHRNQRLYVAHFEGISVAPLSNAPTLALQLMSMPAGVSGGGIDGLYFCESRLVAVQALFGFQQVTAFEMNIPGTGILSSRALERRHPIHDWATTGAVVGNSFHYIANAQLRRLSPLGALSPPTIPGKSALLRLRAACRPPIELDTRSRARR